MSGSEQLSAALESFGESLDALVIVGSSLEADVPAYFLGGLTLSCAALAELARVRSLECYAAVQHVRGVVESEAGLPTADVLRWVRAVILTGDATRGAVTGPWS